MFQTWICTKIRVDIRYPVRFLLEVAKVNMVQLSWGVGIFLVKELHHFFRWNSRIKRRKSSIHPGSPFFSHVDIQSDYEFFQQRVFWLRTYFMLICRLCSRFGGLGSNLCGISEWIQNSGSRWSISIEVIFDLPNISNFPGNHAGSPITIDQGEKFGPCISAWKFHAPQLAKTGRLWEVERRSMGTSR